MAVINENYLKLPGNYLFAEIAERVSQFKAQNPSADIIRLGIGDVTLPLPPAVISTLHQAVDEMATEDTFHGYGPDGGYEFLVRKIIDTDYAPRHIKLDLDEIFVSDGSKSDVGNIQEIFGVHNTVAITDPVYPVYLDTNVMAGRTGELANGKFGKVIYLTCNQANNFVPALPQEKADLIYLCMPNNPTGTTLTKAQLKTWVDYAKANGSILLYDAAYEAYIQQDDIPHSIYEIEGAQDVAIEFRSFSKNAGFTGTRCAFTVVPKSVKALTAAGELYPLNNLWSRRQATKFNGTPYIIQRGAAAVYSAAGKKQVKDLVNYYMTNATVIREGLLSIGLDVYGGVNAPYIWLKVPLGLDSWAFFDKLLTETHIVGTPGSGFGPAGEGYFRLTAFGSQQSTVKAVERLKTRLKL